ncbi:hypothetical protein GKE82_20240 [Conexibacter sp. W3-3-2]|uniref:Uncharacterized protein n=2 Tax=Thermoleophilia TaxID=1497346 RepID=A0A2T4UNK5_9ACTN|nr:hypothetical protein [Conexibacter sp. W3-3-2]PTL60812.1 hypothetical protein C7Y72_11375 [Paraconexibacter algicola]
MDRLGLTDEELCTTLGVAPLEVIGGALEHKPQLPLLLTLTAEAAERVHPDALRRWVRTAGPAGRPLDALLRQDYAAFEDALEALGSRGFVVRAAR